ncbi:MAG: efflux RND transporter periplasmic adaptor subunit [Cyanobacteria bacterium]|nr:efflux RND transporter periplasmic adaptor subunit [Cyanobacteriota bacterium]
MRLLCLILLFFTVACSKQVTQTPVAKPLFVKVAKAELGEITREFETSGELKADKEILVAAERQGMVKEIYVYEGKFVNAGDALIQIEGKDVDADLKKAQSDFASYQNLYEQGAISKQELINYEAQLKRVQSQIDNLKISAISSGVIGVIYVDPGDYVKQGDKILDLVKVYPLRVSYSVPEKLISKIMIGQKLELETDSESGKVFDASVDFISPRVDPETRTVLLRAKITSPSTKLKANQFVKVKQVIESSSNSLLVREESLYLDQGQEYLYLAVLSLRDEGEAIQSGSPRAEGARDDVSYTATRIAVKTGQRQEGKVEILEGIQEGDDVIYAGLHSIYPGAKLVVVED